MAFTTALRTPLRPVRAALNRAVLWFDRDMDSIIGAVPLERIAPEKLSHAGRHRHLAYGYEAASAVWLRMILRSLPIHYPGFTFVDFGSGKGRSLCVAAHFDFKAVVGLELSPALNAEAQRNISAMASAGRLKAGRVTSCCADAAEAELPPGDSVLFFFNPFGKEIFTPIIERIRTAVASGAACHVIYCNPHFPEIFEAAPFLRPVRLTLPLSLAQEITSAYGARLFATPALPHTLRLRDALRRGSA